MGAKESELHRRITDFMEGIKRDFENEPVAVVVLSSEAEDTHINCRNVLHGSRMGVIAAYTSLWKDSEEARNLETAKEFVEYRKKEES